jgi:guanylate kinase
LTLPRAGRIPRLIVISGPSGAGKGTLIARVLERVPGLALSVSATTRPRREDKEVDGRDYYFLSEPEFAARVAKGAFLEWAEFSGHRYGTPREPVMEQLAAGRDVLLEIELEGARQVLEQWPRAVMIFIMPPSLTELERRLRGRKTESEEAIQRRMARAAEEIAAVTEGTWEGAREFDYVIVNNSVNRAADELARIIERIREEHEQADSR